MGYRVFAVLSEGLCKAEVHGNPLSSRALVDEKGFEPLGLLGNLGNSFNRLFKCRQRVRVTNANWRGEGKGSHGTERPQIVVERVVDLEYFDFYVVLF